MSTCERELDKNARYVRDIERFFAALSDGQLSDELMANMIHIGSSNPRLLLKLMSESELVLDDLPTQLRVALAEGQRGASSGHSVFHGGDTDRCFEFMRELEKPDLPEGGQSALPGKDAYARKKCLAHQIAVLMAVCGVSDEAILIGGLIHLAKQGGTLVRVKNRAYLSSFVNDSFESAGTPSSKVWLIDFSPQIVRAIVETWSADELEEYLTSDEFEADFHAVFSNYPNFAHTNAGRCKGFKNGLKAVIHHYVFPAIRDLHASASAPIAISLSDAAESSLMYSTHARVSAEVLHQFETVYSVEHRETMHGIASLSNESFFEKLTRCIKCAKEDARKSRGQRQVMQRKLLSQHLHRLNSELSKGNLRPSPGQAMLLAVVQSFAEAGTPETAKNPKKGGIGRIENYIHAMKGFFLDHIGNDDLRLLDPEEIEERIEQFLRYDRDTQQNNPRNNESPKSLSIAFQRLLEKDLIDELPHCDALTKDNPLTPGGAAVISYEDYREILKLLNQLPDDFQRYRAILMCMLGFHTGARFSEADGMKGDQVMVFNGFLEVEYRTRGTETKKTPASNGAVIGLLKLMPLELEALDYFKKKSLLRGNKADYLFHAGDPKHRFDEISMVRAQITSALRVATGRSNVRYHTFRHTNASLLMAVLGSGDSLFNEWLGPTEHASSPYVLEQLKPGGARQHRSMLALSRRVRHRNCATTVRWYVHNAHIIYGELMATVPWFDLPIDYLSWITAGLIDSPEKLRRCRSKKMPEGFTALKLPSYHRRKQFPQNPTSAIRPLTFLELMHAFLGEPIAGSPDLFPYRDVNNVQRSFMYDEAFRLGAATGLLTLLNAIKKEDFVDLEQPLFCRREFSRLLSCAKALQQRPDLLELISTVGVAVCPHVVNRRLRWTDSERVTLDGVVTLLHSIGVDNSDMDLFVVNGSSIANDLAHSGLNVRCKVEATFRRYGLFCDTGFQLEIAASSVGDLRSAVEVQILCLALLVYSRAHNF